MSVQIKVNEVTRTMFGPNKFELKQLTELHE